MAWGGGLHTDDGVRQFTENDNHFYDSKAEGAVYRSERYNKGGTCGM